MGGLWLAGFLFLVGRFFATLSFGDAGVVCDLLVVGGVIWVLVLERACLLCFDEYWISCVLCLWVSLIVLRGDLWLPVFWISCELLVVSCGLARVAGGFYGCVDDYAL